MTSSASLAQFAIESLHTAATVQPENAMRITEARGVWQPDSWIVHRCWQVLADAGAVNDALTVASLAEMRHPLALLHALHTLVRRDRPSAQLTQTVRHELAQMSARLFSPWIASEQTQQIERLLYAAASAACIDNDTFAFACLERLDQFPRAWDRILVHPEMRTILAETITHVGLHPLTCYLIDSAILNFQDAGAQFIQQIATTIKERRTKRFAGSQQFAPPTRPPVQTESDTSVESALIYNDEFDALMARCVNVCRTTTLTSLHSRRLAATVLAQAGLVDETLKQVHTIATIQDAHRETSSDPRNRGAGFTSQYAGTEYNSDGTSGAWRNGENQVLRQVGRSQSDSDVDFLINTLKNVVEVLPIDHTTARQRLKVGKQIAALGALSDGWTAAGAASTLIKLGGVEDAVEVVDQIDDTTHSEGAIELVNGLLETGQEEYADMQTHAALSWARSLKERMPERATIWGIAEAYLDHNHADRAIQLLDELDANPIQRNLFSRFFSGDWSGDATYTDQDLRSGKLRLRAYLQREMPRAAADGSAPRADEILLDERVSPQTDELIRELCGWAPQLLEGEALITFYLDGILDPLLTAGKSRYAWGLLPQFREALLAVRGTKHATRVGQITIPLAETLHSYAAKANTAGSKKHTAAMRQRLEEFCVLLWQENSRQGIWQSVYGIDGSLPMLLALEGPDALVEIANAAANEGALWSRVDE